MENIPNKKNDILNKIIQSSLLEKPSPDFTNNVMNKLGIAPAAATIKYEPVISKKGWIFISVVVLTIFLISFLGYEKGSNESIGLNTAVAMQHFENTLTNIFSGSAVMYATLLSFVVFLLFFAESVFRQSRIRSIPI